MNPLQAMSQDDQNVVEFSESPGRRLRVQRQSRGLEVERVAAQLHLRVAMVEALEQDRFEDLPGSVFVAGYLRNYARLLGLDPEPLIIAYRAANPEPEPAVVRFGPTHKQAISRELGQEIGSGHILVRLVSVGLVLAVIAMIALWWWNRAEQLPGPTTSDSPALPLAAPAGAGLPPATRPPLERATGTAIQGADTASPSLPLPAATGGRPTSTPDQTPNPTSAPPRSPTSAATESADLAAAAPASAKTDAQGGAPAEPATDAAVPATQVALTFTGTSWVKVKDAAGSVVLNGEMHNGDTRVLTGNPPYSFSIGNASAGVAHISIGGRPFDFGHRTQGGVARFKLDPRNPQ